MDYDDKIATIHADLGGLGWFCQVIKYIATNPTQPKLMGHIAADLNLNSATCVNIIKTMVHQMFIKKGHKQKGNLLGAAITEISNGSFSYKNMLARATIEMDKTEKLLEENNKKII